MYDWKNEKKKSKYIQINQIKENNMKTTKIYYYNKSSKFQYKYC